jgi:predicted Co/Zn/Cd cation transporter (cation efflux family)
MHAETLMKNPAFLLHRCVLFLVVGTEDLLDGGQDISLQTIIVMGCASHMVSVLM